MTALLDVASEVPARLHPPADRPDPLNLLAGELKRQLETRRDILADTRVVSLSPTVPGGAAGAVLNVDMPTGVETFGVNRHAHQQIADHLGVGWRLYDRLLNGVAGDGKRRKGKAAQPDLLVHLANGLLSREPSTRLLRVMDGRLRAFLSNAYRPRDNWDLLEQAILPVLSEYPGVVVRQAHLTETNMYVKIALPGSARIPGLRPQVGDVLHAGLVVRNSEVGASSLLVAPYTIVLSCINGQTHTEYGKRQRHVGGRLTNDDADSWELYSDETLALDDAAFFAKVQDTVRAALSGEVFRLIVQDIEQLADHVVEAPAAPAVEVFRKHVGATEEEGGSILNHLIAGGSLTAWAYVNALTATARDLPDPDRQAELEQVAGRLIAKPGSWLPELARVKAPTLGEATQP